MPQLSQTPQAAQAKQLAARRKMHGYPIHMPLVRGGNPERHIEPINKGNWHEQYLKRVAK
jgi:hypothetical protein